MFVGIIDGLVDPKTERVLKLFLRNKNELYHINRVSEEAKVPLATTFRIIKVLASLEIIETLHVSKFKIYRLSKNKKTKSLGGIL